MRNAGLDEAQARIKFSRRNINNLRYADDTTLMAESEEELKSLLIKFKEESEKIGLNVNVQKTKIMTSSPISSCETDGELVADFIARRDNKDFLSNQCKEIEENNRMGKTRDLVKKIRDIKGIFQAKMCSIKDRNGMDLTDAEDIKKRWQEYTEELYKTDLHDSDNHNGVITHLEPDILEC